MSEHPGELGAGLSTEYGVAAGDCHWNRRGQQESGEASGHGAQFVLVWPLAPPLGHGTLGKSLKVVWTSALPSGKWDCSPPHRIVMRLLSAVRIAPGGLAHGKYSGHAFLFFF